MSDTTLPTKSGSRYGLAIAVVGWLGAACLELYLQSQAIEPPAHRVDLFTSWAPWGMVFHNTLFWTLFALWGGVKIGHFVNPARIRSFPWFTASRTVFVVAAIFLCICLGDDYARARSWEIRIAGMPLVLAAATVLMLGLMVRTIVVVLTGKIMEDKDNLTGSEQRQ